MRRRALLQFRLRACLLCVCSEPWTRRGRLGRRALRQLLPPSRARGPSRSQRRKQVRSGPAVARAAAREFRGAASPPHCPSVDNAHHPFLAIKPVQEWHQVTQGVNARRCLPHRRRLHLVSWHRRCRHHRLEVCRQQRDSEALGPCMQQCAGSSTSGSSRCSPTMPLCGCNHIQESTSLPTKCCSLRTGGPEASRMRKPRQR